MPELPEVETITRNLREGILDRPPLPGQVIQAIILRWPRHIVRPSPTTFRAKVKGCEILDVQRRGKFIVIPLDQGALLFHLMMSGDLYVAPSLTPREKHEHTIFSLEENWELRFHDPRKFGRIFWLLDPDEVLGNLGIEPLSTAFTSQKLAQLLHTRQRTLKPLLLDQTIIAGIGNIYADEALHRARLHPARRSDTLTKQEIQALHRGIRAALRKGIKLQGASIDWMYKGGDFQNHFRVYGRTGEACPVCRDPIQRIVLGQRSTHYCPSCQAESVA